MERKALCLLTAAALAWLGTAPGAARADGGNHCTATASSAFRACDFESRDDYWTGRSICRNISDADAREECFADTLTSILEAWEECLEQFEARLDLCDQLGEERYDPDFDPADFETDFDSVAKVNPYLPIAVGNSWEYVGGEETVIVEVLDKTKSIEGVTCIVVNDRVEVDGEVAEDTDDWFAHAVDGDVWYCGEISRNYEFFAGDDPEEAELVDTEGSWKAGRDGSKPGVLVPAAPQVGDVYRQEWAPGDAEDAAEVLSTTYSFGDDPDLDENVPQELAELLCAGDCLVTREFSPLEPGHEEHKFYAPGLGLFLEVDPESGDIVQLVDCNFNPVCDTLPEP